MGKFIKTESKLVTTKDWDEGEMRSDYWMWSTFFCGDESYLELQRTHKFIILKTSLHCMLQMIEL